MTIAFVFESDKLGHAEYDQLMKGIGREAVDAPNPQGYIAHLAGPRAEGGWRVVDIWDSEQAANAFYGSDDVRGGERPRRRDGARHQALAAAPRRDRPDRQRDQLIHAPRQGRAR